MTTDQPDRQGASATPKLAKQPSASKSVTLVEAYERGWREAMAKVYWTSDRWNEGHDTFWDGYIYTKTLENVNSYEFFGWSEEQLRLSQQDTRSTVSQDKSSKNARGQGGHNAE